MGNDVDNVGTLYIDPDGAIDFGRKTVVGGFKFPGVAYASLPVASAAANRIFKVTNVGPSGYGSLWISNGTRWSPLGGRVTLATLNASAVAGVANSETIEVQATLPVNCWQQFDTVRVSATMTKSGTTDTANLTIRCGTAGTTGDTALVSAAAFLAAANRTGGGMFDFKLETATTALRVGNQGVLGAWSQAAATALPAATTITSAAANTLIFSVSIASSSTNDTVGLTSCFIELLTP